MPSLTLEKTYSLYERVADYSVRRLPMVGKGSLAILDQALISGSNFIVGIFLARWVVPTQYGAYALAFSIFLLLSLIHQSLLLEPQSVYGPSEHADNLQQYLGALLWLHVALALVIFLVLGILAFVGYKVGWNSGLPAALFGVTIAAPSVLLFWLVRGACYVKLAPHEAVQGSLVYFVLLISSFFLLSRKGMISPLSVFLLMAAGSLISSVLLLIRLKPIMSFPAEAFLRTKVIRMHWIYGRWALASCLTIWVPWNIYYSVIGRHSSMGEAGALRALMNLFLPLGQTLSALSLLLLPYAARRHGEEGRVGTLNQMWKTMLLFVSGAFVYWAAVIPLRHPIMRTLYNDHYTNVAYLLPWLALASTFWFATHSTALTLRAMQLPSSVFVVYSAATVVCVLIGIPAAWTFGLQGVMWGLNLSSFAALVTGVVLVNVKARGFSQLRITKISGEETTS